MYKFSRKSLSKLETCHKDLQILFNQVIKNIDCIILEGYRDSEKQKELFEEGKSKIIKSKHNLKPSYAIDVAPYPIPYKWGDINYKNPPKGDELNRIIKVKKIGSSSIAIMYTPKYSFVQDKKGK